MWNRRMKILFIASPYPEICPFEDRRVKKTLNDT